jgi:hypothetical protein
MMSMYSPTGMAAALLRSSPRKPAQPLRVLTPLVAATLVLAPLPAMAWDGIVSGVINSIHSAVGTTNNYEFRVQLTGQTGQWCGSTTPAAAGWAGLHQSDANFKGMQASLMLAAASGRPVLLYLTRDSAGLCKIGYAVVNMAG